MFIPEQPQFYEAKLGGYLPVMWANNVAVSAAEHPFSFAAIGSLYMYRTSATWYRKVADNKDANDWADALGGGVTDHGALTGLGDDDHAQYHNDARGDARYRSIYTVGVDGDHFNDDGASTPAGWTETSAASSSDTVTKHSYWYTRLTSGTGSLDYYHQSSGNLSGTWESFLFSGVQVRDGGYTGDLDLYYGINGDDGTGAPDDDVFLRAHLQWDSAAEIWQVRGEEKDGTTQTDGTWFPLDEFMPENMFFRLTKRRTATTNRVYFGYSGGVDQQKLIFSGAFSDSLWNGDEIFRYEADHGGGVVAYMYIDSIDETDAS